MSNMVTRCPQCQTSFKVTDEHLKIANGAVRCGSCLHVFQARQHWVKPDAPASAPVRPATAPVAAAAPPPPPATSTTGKFSFDQSAIDGALAGDALGDSPALPDTGMSQSHASPAAPAAQRKLEELGDDDRISDDMALDDDEPVITPPKKSGTAAATGSGFGTPDDDYSSLFDEFDEGEGATDYDSLASGDFNDLDQLTGNAEDESGTGTSDESWARDMLEELKEEEKPEPIDLGQVRDIRDILTDFTDPVDVDAARRDLGIDNDMASARGGKAVDRAELLAHIEPPPVEMTSSGYRTQVDWQSLLRWNAAVVILVLLLAVQYVGFHFTSLAKNDATRSYMQSLCTALRCSLPPVENWRYIKISNLVVRQHPSVGDGLAIDAILMNVTRHEQPFPKLELFFSDMAKTPIASRRFEPAEYLSGEMSGKTTMPPGRPVHIALEIVNPGAGAVNWNLQVAGKTQ